MPRAAVCTAIDQPLEIVDVELAPPGPGEVQVQLVASGVCHSDLSVKNGTLLQPLPAVLGHEGAGIVEAVGEGVTNVEPGDHIVISWVPQCGECYMCRHDQGELCETGSVGLMTGGLLDGTPRYSRDGAPLFHMAASGTFSQTTVIPAIGAVKIDDDIPLTSAALIGCGVLTGFGAAVNTADIRAGDTVVVIGCGGVGLNVIQGAKHAGAERIVALDMVDSKLELAKQFGATDTINPASTEPLPAVQEMTAGRGADVAFEVIGLKSTIEQALQLTRRGGQAVLVGVPKMDVMVEIPAAMELLIMEKQVRGCWYGSSNVHRDVPMLARLYKEGALKLDELISQEIALADVNDAFTAMESGTVARSVITRF